MNESQQVQDSTIAATPGFTLNPWAIAARIVWLIARIAWAVAAVYWVVRFNELIYSPRHLMPDFVAPEVVDGTTFSLGLWATVAGELIALAIQIPSLLTVSSALRGLVSAFQAFLMIFCINFIILNYNNGNQTGVLLSSIALAINLALILVLAFLLHRKQARD